jgi:predicted dehydrogenase
MLKVVVIGTGWWGMELGKAAKGRPDKVELGGCCSLSEAECAKFIAAYGGKRWNSYEEVLADKSVDAVMLATPHSLHWTQIIAAAEAGKHVFCEKPFTLSVETASKAIRACEKAKVVLAVGHNRRFLPGPRRMKAMIDAGELGTIIHVDAHYSGNIEGRYPKEHWRVQQSEIPAGSTTPMGLHVVDTLTWLLGPVARLVAITKHQALSYPLDDTCAALFELNSGVTGQYSAHLAVAMSSMLKVYGTKANLECRNAFSELTIEPTDATKPREFIRYTHDDSLQQEVAALADAAAGGTPYPIKPLEALRNIGVLEAIMKSAASGNAWVSVAQGLTAQ